MSNRQPDEIFFFIIHVMTSAMYKFRIPVGTNRKIKVYWPNCPKSLERYNVIITNGTYSCVLAEPENNKWLLRVTTDECARSDYEFQSQMADAGLAPRVGELYTGLYSEDLNGQRAEMHAWLTERFEITMHDWLKSPNKPNVNYFRVFVWLTQLKPLILKMHNMCKLIHGDLRWHMKNIVLRFTIPGDQKSGIAECKFIDFGFSRSMDQFQPNNYPSWYSDVTEEHNRNHGALIIFSKDDFQAEAKYELEQAEALLIAPLYEAMHSRCAVNVKPKNAATSKRPRIEITTK